MYFKVERKLENHCINRRLPSLWMRKTGVIEDRGWIKNRHCALQLTEEFAIFKNHPAFGCVFRVEKFLLKTSCTAKLTNIFRFLNFDNFPEDFVLWLLQNQPLLYSLGYLSALTDLFVKIVRFTFCLRKLVCLPVHLSDNLRPVCLFLVWLLSCILEFFCRWFRGKVEEAVLV